MKALLYCTKGSPFLHQDSDYAGDAYKEIGTYWFDWSLSKEKRGHDCNGKIVAVCEIETEERPNYGISRRSEYALKGTCLTMEQLDAYLPKHKDYDDKDIYYALHISKVRLVSTNSTFENYFIYKDFERTRRVLKAPSNMMKVYDILGKEYILISVNPESLYKILKDEKDVEIRKKVLKEMKQ